MKNHRTTPGEPAPRQPGAPLVPAQRPSEEDLRELHDPDDYDPGFPDRDDGWPQRRPQYVIVVDQIRGTGAAPSLAELLENLTARTPGPQPGPEPDLEAEP